MILAIVPEILEFRKAKKGFSLPFFPQKSQNPQAVFYFLLKLSFKDTLRLKTRWPGAASRSSRQK